MAIFSKYKLLILGLVIGATGGYLYYFFVGCESGHCLITSNPLPSTAYGAMMGALLLTSFKKKKSQDPSDDQHMD